MYEYFLKPIFFCFDPELMHDFFVWFGGKIGATALGRATVHFFCFYNHPSLHTNVAGIDFENPIGLGAGFDKNMRLTKIMPAMGFGFMEVGAVTHLPFKGNDGTRFARLPADNSLIVYYGLKNIGAEAIVAKLPRLQDTAGRFALPVGVNIAKTNRADIKGSASVEDYAASYRMLSPHFSYVTLNVSCPNAQDGTLFQDPKMLDGLLAVLAREEKKVPVFLKISNHLSTAEVDDILAVVKKYPFVDGFVVGNLSKRRDQLSFKSSKKELDVIPQGGISGAPIRKISTDLVRHIYSRTNAAGEKYTIIGLGGVFTAEDAYEKILAGASLVQMVTGLIYEGPMAVKRINKGLVKLLKRDGYAHIADAVGKERKD
jgi:dihydroorotate dehydrogenase